MSPGAWQHGRRARPTKQKKNIPGVEMMGREAEGSSSGVKGPLCLDGVLSLEHVVDLGQVVGTGGNGGDLALGDEVLLEVSLLSEVAHL